MITMIVIVMMNGDGHGNALHAVALSQANSKSTS
jgi:hypothetical protein